MKTGNRQSGIGNRRRVLWPAVTTCAALLGLTAWDFDSRFPMADSRSVQSCPAPRVSDWSSIRDTLWPLIVHRDGDEAWAHLEPDSLPRNSATWCNPLQNSPEAIRAGRDTYVAVCASCHGDEGRGDGPAGGVQTPPPYDFTRREFAGMREAPGAGVLYAIVTRGIDGTSMTGFPSSVLSGYERLAVIAYITSLPGPGAIAASGAWADTLRARRAAAPPR